MMTMLCRMAAWLHLKTAWSVAAPSPPCCRLAPTARLFPTAKILNHLLDSKRIQIGAHTFIKGELLTFAHGGDIRIGQWCYVGEGTRIWSASSIHIGDRVLISHNVNLFDNDTHPIDDPEARHLQFVSIMTSGHPDSLNLNECPVRIEDDVLIGCQAIILSGVVIGKGAVIAAGAVVTRSVEPYTLVAGNPARPIRALHPRETA